MSTATSFAAARTRNLLIAILLPLLLVGVYLASLGGAAQASAKLPAVIVNNDQMVEQANNDGTTTPVVAGRLLVSWLTNPENAGEFNWTLAKPEHAQQLLESGEAYVAVTIPSDFSASIVSAGGGSPRAAKIEVTTSQSRDYLTGAVSQQLFDGLVAEFGQTITNQIAVGLADGVNQSAEGLQLAADGASQLADGASQLGDGFGQYRDGQSQLAEGTSQAADGASQLADGASLFGNGVSSYVDGVGQYLDGAGTLAGGVRDYVDGVNTYSLGVDQFAGGVRDLNDGMQQLADGAGPLGDAATQLGDMAGQLEGASGQINDAIDAAEQLRPLLEGLASVDPSSLYEICTALEAVDPAQAESCRGEIDTLIEAIDTSGLDLGTITTGFDNAIEGLRQLSGAGGQLSQLADGLGQFTDGVKQAADGTSQLADGAGALIDGGVAIRDGGSKLADGANQLTGANSQLRDGGSQLTDGAAGISGGASDLAQGLDALADGQQQIVDGGEPLADGITQLGDGATTMAKSLQEGADQAKVAIQDPDAFAAVVSQPVTVSTVPTQDPGFGGVLASIAMPLGVWLAALITALRRRLVTADLLNSSASNAMILLTAARRLLAPVGIVAAVLAIVPHVFVGAPWIGLGGSLLFAALVTLVVVAAHLLFAILWDRRNAAIASITALAIQLVLVRGFIPLEIKASWAESLAGLLPLSQAAAGMQSLYAGGTIGSIFGPAALLALGAIALFAIAAVALMRKRRASVAKLLAAAG